MIRSRLLFIFLVLAYLGVTPVGAYTCACIIPQSGSLQIDLDDIADQSSLPDTAVATLLGYLSLNFMLAAAVFLTMRRVYDRRLALLSLEPYRFCEPPPTPPPPLA